MLAHALSARIWRPGNISFKEVVDLMQRVLIEGDLLSREDTAFHQVVSL